MVATVSAAPKRSKRALNDYSVEVGRRIVQARNEYPEGKITQEELAELAGVSQRSMQAYETGEVIPYRKMRDIAEALNVSTSWLLHGEDENSDNEIADLKDQIGNLEKLIRQMSRKLDKLSG